MDLTGGAPELCPSFATLVRGARALGRRVIVRCNLTVLFEPGMEWLPAFYREHVAELPALVPDRSVVADVRWTSRSVPIA